MSENFARESLGQYLRKQREDRNISLEQVAYATRISIKMLRALEDDHHNILPSATFVRGYLQAYSKYVRIDEQDVLLRYQHFLASTPAGQKTALKSHYPYVKERNQEKYKMLLIIAGFFGLILVIGVVVAFRSKHHGKSRSSTVASAPANTSNNTNSSASPENTSAPSTPLPNPITSALAALKSSNIDAMKQAETFAPVLPLPTKPSNDTAPAQLTVKSEAAKNEPEKTEAAKTEPNKSEPVKTEPQKTEPIKQAANDPAMNAKPVGKKHILSLSTDIDVWFRFQTDNGPIKEMTLRAGKNLTLAADEVIKIFSGNLPALKATFNGQPVSSLASSTRPKSAVLPESEAPKYPPPLFPPLNPSPSTAANSAPAPKTN